MDKSSQYKIFSDPIHGFITVPKGVILKLIDHPYVQRLRRVRQLGLGYLVFPAAEHSRFSHALGALELCQRVLKNLVEKDTTISDAEIKGTLIAILLHDVGHGPFSHTLEHTLIDDFNHEKMSLKIMHQLNKEFDGELTTAIDIFTDQYPKKFLHQLISSQLDIDRLDYLKRDSFFTGVSEGSVGINRILKTMRILNGNVVIEKKGIYAVENYILSRRLMYMQVYLHKTVLSADSLLKQIFRRVEYLLQNGESLHTPSWHLEYFLTEKRSAKKSISDVIMKHYMALDDHDVLISIKAWAEQSDPILRDLSIRFLQRDLFRSTFLPQNKIDKQIGKFTSQTKQVLKQKGLPFDDESVSYYIDIDKSYSEAYKYENESIWILEGKSKAVEFSKAVDTRHIIALTQPVVKPYIVHLKELN
ncbi:HD domain-containing protein [Rhodohalobacter sp. SW132]|uniref:HD domain-containing protein n=1 Tax=Rhodohalobacter sp. SW132 TaxID=2293433 RepID=UPI000E233833|nr:HD domain-containing protein [Rhodohalobacter sp. SW132]REL33660.1 HD domain-containing protein [Rhodohalobacter sp. SW132]